MYIFYFKDLFYRPPNLSDVLFASICHDQDNDRYNYILMLQYIILIAAEWVCVYGTLGSQNIVWGFHTAHLARVNRVRTQCQLISSQCHQALPQFIPLLTSALVTNYHSYVLTSALMSYQALPSSSFLTGTLISVS